MTVYVDIVAFLNFFVDYLLLLGTNRLCGYPAYWGRSALAAAIGGIYAGMCLLPGFYFLGQVHWRMICLFTMGYLAFGLSVSALRRIFVFFLLSMALGGIGVGLGVGGYVSLLTAAGVLTALCFFGFRDKLGSKTYVPVELSYNDRHICLTALQDTGNTLLDPVTGRSVLVISPDVAQKLIGLTPAQLSNPVETVSLAVLPGLRLIPFQSIGRSGGLMLAMHLQDVKIGKWKGSSLVAFAPEGISREGAYQALTGGVA